MMVMIVGVASIASGQVFWDDFESYPAGQIVGQGGWEGWAGDAGAGAPVSTAQAFSGTKSIEIVPTADLVHTYDISGGKWVFTAKQYIPSGKTGQTYFILLNQYGAANDWSIQTTYNLATGAIATWTGAVSTTIAFDQWVELKYIIDLDLNSVTEYYNGVEIDTRVWDDNTHGTLQAVDLYGNSAGSVYYDDIRLLPYLMSLTAADTPSPASQATDVPRDGVISWSPGYFAGSHNLYIGTDSDSVSNATVPTAAGLDVNSFDPGRLEFGQAYYWRVDEVNATPDRTVYKGEVWSFTAEPYAVQIPAADIAVSASSYNGANDPNRMIDGTGLTGDAHGNEDGTVWNSMPTDMQPVLVFAFPKAQALDSIVVWNNNLKLEPFVGMGVKDIVLETSLDGETWTVVEGVTSLTRAAGADVYDTPDVIALNGLKASQVRLQILSNYGGLPVGMGLSEIQFYAIPTYARQPMPAVGAGDVVPNAIVKWRAGREAGQHTIYVSDDPNALTDGSAPSLSSVTDSVDLGSLDLELGKTYYWRVDEVNEAEATTVWPGPVWSFTTTDALVVDDFEGYNNFSPDRPFQTWLDGYGYSADDYFSVKYDGNGTGSGIGHDIWSPGSPYFAGQTMEQASTMPGSTQSMPLYYTNAGAVASKTDRNFAVPQDWTVGDAKTLSISFSGKAGNTGSLFVMINNVKIAYPGDAGNIALDTWQAWNIDLSSVNTNLQSVTKLTIGVDGSNASGLLLIDDIKLYAKAGEVLTPVEPSSDALVGAWSFDEGSGTVAADSSGHGHNGTIVNGTWEAGPVGSALHFDGTSTQVTISSGAWDTIDQQVTVSLWTYVDSSITQSPVTFAAYRDPANGNTRVINTHIVWSNSNLYFDTGGDGTGYDRINKLATASVYGDAWVHWAFTKNAETGEQKVYRNGTLWLSGTGLTRTMTGVTTFTLGAHNGGSFWNGSMDEFELYNKELTQEEILWLAGVKAPIDKPF
ncbi:MAG: discoidin domain-containing protein [Phycisphaerae bacterium]|nr:discoidin domain-containing protein [Phycisphaerae bacterium]